MLWITSFNIYLRRKISNHFQIAYHYFCLNSEIVTFLFPGDFIGCVLAWCSLLPIFILVSFVTLILFRRDLHTVSKALNISRDWESKHLLSRTEKHNATWLSHGTQSYALSIEESNIETVAVVNNGHQSDYHCSCTLWHAGSCSRSSG